MTFRPTLRQETPPPAPEIGELVPAPQGYRAVLQNRKFLALWIGQVLSQLGDRIVFVAFIATLAHYYGSGVHYTSFLYVAFTIPAILFTAIAGVFVDRWSRRGMLVITNLLRGVLVLLLPMAAHANLWALYALAFLLSSATQFFVPAEAATIPMIVPKSQLLTANSLFTTTMMGSVIFGFALGDPLINIFSLGQIHWPIAALFLSAGAVLQFIRTPPKTSEAQGALIECASPPTFRGACKDFFAEMRDGILYIQSNPLILRSMLKLACLFSAVVALCILFVSFAKEFLYDNPEVAARKFAYIITWSGVGMVMGAFLVGRYFRDISRSWMVYSGYLDLGVCLLLLGLIETFAKTDRLLNLPAVITPFFYLDSIHLTVRMLYTYILATFMGIGTAFIAIPLQALIHELLPEDKRGKILGVQFTLLSTCSTLPVLVAGLGAEQIGVKPMFLLIGLFFLFFGLRGLYLKLRGKHAASANW